MYRHFCVSASTFFIVRKAGTILPTAVGLTAGQQTKYEWISKNLKLSYVKLFRFLLYLISAQRHYSVTSVLFYAGFSQGKGYANKFQAIDCMFIPTTKYSCNLA